MELNSPSKRSHARAVQSERGFSLIVTALCLTVMIGLMGLVTDAGHLFITRSELQAYVDSAGMAAASKLDGTAAGIDRAEILARSGPLGSTVPNGILYDSQAVPNANITTAYRTSLTGSDLSYAQAQSSPANVQFVVVQASQPVSMTFARIAGASASHTMSARAVAGQAVLTNPGVSNIAPFSPSAHTPAGPDFGFTTNVAYTLKWGNGNATDCAGDQAFNPGNDPPQHGYIDVGQGNGSSGLEQVIEYGLCPDCPLYTGDHVDGVAGNRAVAGTYLRDLALQDSDQSSTTWAQYASSQTGNNRRVITVPIHDPSQTTSHGNGNETYTIIGFSNFLLLPGSNYSNTSGSLCAVYIGPANKYAGGSVAGTGTSVSKVNLFQ